MEPKHNDNNEPHKEMIDGSLLYRDSTDFRSHEAREANCECAACNSLRYGLVSKDSYGTIVRIGPNAAKIMELAGDYVRLLIDDMAIEVAAAFSQCAMQQVFEGMLSDESLRLMAGATSTVSDLLTTQTFLYRLAKGLNDYVDDENNNDDEHSITVDLLKRTFGVGSDIADSPSDKAFNDTEIVQKMREWKAQHDKETDK